jgi:hypothetical protein
MTPTLFGNLGAVPGDVWLKATTWLGTAIASWPQPFPILGHDPGADTLGRFALRRRWSIHLDRSMANHAVTTSRSWDIYGKAKGTWLGIHQDRILDLYSFATLDVPLVKQPT